MATIKKLKYSEGQVIIGALAIMLVAGIMMIILFNKGLALKEKTRLVNAADAAAYSEGVITARRLNFLAYTNRAMVVNNLAAGHSVNTISWLRYITNVWQDNPQFYNYGGLFDPSPTWLVRGAMFLGMNAVVNQQNESVNRVAQFLANMVAANNELAAAQQDTLANSLDVNASIRNVVVVQYNDPYSNNTIRVNDPDDLQNTINLATEIGNDTLATELSNLANGNEDTELLAFVQTSTNMAELEQMTLLGLNGRIPSDHWYNARDWRTNTDGDGRTKLFSTSYSNANTGTVWQADQTGIQPLASGSANSDWQASDAVTQADGTTIAYTGQASALELFAGYQHFPGSHTHLADNDEGRPLNTTLSRTVFLSKDLRAQEVNNPLAPNNEGLRSFDAVQHVNDPFSGEPPVILTAYARAEVYYQRPSALASDNFSFAAIPAGAIEFANLYNPFWQVRLVSIPTDF